MPLCRSWASLAFTKAASLFTPVEGEEAFLQSTELIPQIWPRGIRDGNSREEDGPPPFWVLTHSSEFKIAAHAVKTHADLILFLIGLDSQKSWLCCGDKGLFSVGSGPRRLAGQQGGNGALASPTVRTAYVHHKARFFFFFFYDSHSQTME